MLMVVLDSRECLPALQPSRGLQSALEQMTFLLSFVLDVTTIKNVVGQVKTKGVIGGREWVFIDQSNDVARTTFQCTNNGDKGYEEDDCSFSIVMYCSH